MDRTSQRYKWITEQNVKAEKCVFQRIYSDETFLFLGMLMVDIV